MCQALLTALSPERYVHARFTNWKGEDLPKAITMESWHQSQGFLSVPLMLPVLGWGERSDKAVPGLKGSRTAGLREWNSDKG